VEAGHKTNLDNKCTCGRSPTIITTPEHHQLEEWAERLSQDYLPDGWQRVHSSASTKVAHHQALGLFYKEYLRRSPWTALRAIVSGSSAAKVVKNTDRLRYAGIDAPTVVHHGKLHGQQREYLFTAAARGCSILQWLRQLTNSGDPQSHVIKRELLSSLGVFVGRIHGSGFIHGDLRASKIFAEHLDFGFRFTLLDNEHNSHSHPPPGRLLLKDLTQLNRLSSEVISIRDRIRFFRAWRRQLRELSKKETQVLAYEAYSHAMGRVAIESIGDK